MIEKILDERSNKLKKEFLKLDLNKMDLDIIADIHNTDITDTSGDEVVRFYIDIEDHSYNVFIREKHFTDIEDESNDLLYKNIAKAIIECKNNNILTKKETLFLIINCKVLEFDCYYASQSIITIEKAANIYNTILKNYNNSWNLNFEKKSIEEFEKEFESWIFEIADIQLINIFNLIYELLA